MNNKAKNGTGHERAEAKKLLCCDIDAAQPNPENAVAPILDDWFEMANAGRGGPVADIDNDEARAAVFYDVMDFIDAGQKPRALGALKKLLKHWAAD